MRALLLLVALFGLQAQESKPIPKDSVLIDAPGCLKGRVFTGTPRPEAEGTMRGPDVTGRHFRVAGPRDVMDLVKKFNGQLVQLVGLVRRADMDDRGVELGGGRRGRVTIGGGMDPSRMTPNAAPTNVPTMDVTAVRVLSERCPIE